MQPLIWVVVIPAVCLWCSVIFQTAAKFFGMIILVVLNFIIQLEAALSATMLGGGSAKYKHFNKYTLHVYYRQFSTLLTVSTELKYMI